MTQLVTTTATRLISVDDRTVESVLPWYSYNWWVYARMFVIAMPFAAFLIITRTVWGFLTAGLLPSRGEVITIRRSLCTGAVKEAMIILPVTLYGVVFTAAQLFSGSVDARKAIAFVYVGICSLGAGFLGRGWTIRRASLPKRVGILACAALWAVISVGTIIGFRLPRLRVLSCAPFYHVLELLGL
ncbi:MAG: hypothetical protein JRI67_13225 [Deltaproteobacteria bacterium]|nr:hypothetical protein [Deltaproteobacteria bacterium]